jgi:hypothetical protein
MSKLVAMFFTLPIVCGCQSATHRADPEQSWSLGLVPFMEASNLYSAIDMHRPWNDLLNAPYTAQSLHYFLSPHESISKDENGFGLIHFAATSKVFVLSGERRTFDDGLKSSDVMLGEVCDGYMAWAAPGNVRDANNGIKFDTDSFGSPVKSGAVFAYVDGLSHS